jgi:hypothetical protein
MFRESWRYGNQEDVGDPVGLAERLNWTSYVSGVHFKNKPPSGGMVSVSE